MLTFLIPVRHHQTVSDWTRVVAQMRTTISSISAQDNAAWNAIIIANEGAELPELPSRFEVVRVDFPPNKLSRTGPIEEFYSAVRRDKGGRLLAGLKHAPKDGHLMVVDYDDMISCRLAGLVADQPSSTGWYLDKGYLFSGGNELFLYDWMFHKFCGTSHIVKTSTFAPLFENEPADDHLVSRWLGSHIYIKDDLDSTATPLLPLPFVGAVYRVGHPHATSGSRSLREFIKAQNHGDSSGISLRMAKLKTLTQDQANEFFCGNTEPL